MSALFPQVEFKVNGQSLTRVPAKYLAEFRYTTRLGDGGRVGNYQWEVVLYDPFYKEVEAAIFSSSVLPGPGLPPSAQVEFKFGYFDSTEERNIRPQFGVLTSVTSDFGANGGFRFTMTGMPRAQAQQFAVYSKAWGGTFDEILAKIAEQAQLTLDMDPTDDDGLDKQTGKPRVILQDKRSILDVIQKDILPVARAKDKSLGNYYFSLGDHWDPSFPQLPENSKGMLIFKAQPRRVTQIPKPYEFKFLYGVKGDVLRFQPQLATQGIGAAGMGALLTASLDFKNKRAEMVSLDIGAPELSELRDPAMIQGADYIEPGTAEQGVIDASQAVSNAQGAAASNTEQAIGAVKNIAKKQDLMFISPHTTLAEQKAIAYRKWNELYNLLQTATLEVVGTPATTGIRGGSFVRILMLLPSGLPHYSSGVYRVQEAVHEITQQSYTIRMTLFAKMPLIRS